MERTRLESRAVLSAGYDEGAQVLEIEFSSGRIYQFDAVPRSVFEWLLRTPSKGGFVTRMINPQYAYRDVTPRLVTDAGDLAERLRESVRWLDKEKSP
jgi:KTSC domain